METRDVCVFVLDTLADWEVGHAIAHINSPEWQKQPGRYVVRTVGVERKPIKTMGGLTIQPDLTLDELDVRHCAMLVLPGGSAWDRGEGGAVIARALQLQAAGVTLAAICGATAALARAGALNDRAHTSNALQYLEPQPGYRGSAFYRDTAAIHDRGIITAGSTAPVAFAREIFRALDLYSERVLNAWFGLFSTGEPRYYFELMQAGP